MSQHIFRSSVELQNSREGSLRTLASLSVRERLARYGSSALSGVEHLRLLVGRDSAVDTLLRHFGSLKELERASFHVLKLRVGNYYHNGARRRLRLHEKGGKEHEMPVHHLLEEILNEYIAAAGLQSGQPLFQSVNSLRNGSDRTSS